MNFALFMIWILLSFCLSLGNGHWVDRPSFSWKVVHFVRSSEDPVPSHICLPQRWAADAGGAKRYPPWVLGCGIRIFTQLCHSLDLRGHTLDCRLCRGHLPVGELENRGSGLLQMVKRKWAQPWETGESPAWWCQCYFSPEALESGYLIICLIW